MRFKLGLLIKNLKEDDKSLIDEMFMLLDEFGFDYTIFMRNLSLITVDETFNQSDYLNPLDNAFVDIAIEYSMDMDYFDTKLKPKMNPNLLTKLMEICNRN